MRRLLVVPALLALAVVPALADPPKTETIKDRASYIPVRKYAAVQGKAIGVLFNGRDIVALDGRSGPADALTFSTDGNSYRWVYVPTQGNPLITNLRLPVGDKGETQMFPALDMANPKSVVPWGVTEPISLVEATVNGGLGSPASESFAGTSFKVLDGTKDYPLKVNQVVADLKKQYADHLKAIEKDIEKAMADAGKKALDGKTATGPREKSELMHVTWLSDRDVLQVRYRTKISDGHYTVTKVGPNPKVPPFLPPPPQKGQGNGVNFRVAPPPGGFQMKTGVTFGVEFGRGYEVNKKGEVITIQDLPFEAFEQKINAPVFGPGPRPVPLPPVRPGVQPAPKPVDL